MTMELKRYENVEQLLEGLEEGGNIHIECSREQSKELCRILEKKWQGKNAAFLTETDQGYERDTVKGYLGFYRSLLGAAVELEELLKMFGLSGIARKKLRFLHAGERVMVQIARIHMQNSPLVCLQEPLLDLSGEEMKLLLGWMEERSLAGVQFVTANVSLRCALLMPGKAFYQKDTWFCEVDQEQGEAEEGQEAEILKIPAKSGNTVLLFEPNEIDYIESLGGSNYVSVRGEAFVVQQTMEELERLLQKAGFFRCHRSYIVNVQKVQRLERMTKNSYALILNNKDASQVPLAKGRIEEMKQTFGW